MILKFKEEYKSITKNFKDIEISDFSIFTGKNGSGKTHLLKAIKEGKISVNDFSTKQILYLNYIDFVQDFQRKTNHNDKINAWSRLGNDGDIIGQLKNYESSMRVYKDEIEKAAKKKGVPFVDLKVEDIENEKAADIILLIQEYKRNIINLLEEQNYANDEFALSIFISVICKSEIFLSEINENNFNILFQKNRLPNKILSDLSTVFFEYFKNDYRNNDNKRRGKPFLEPEIFIKKYGVPPWELIRNIFSGFGLNFDVNDPVESDIDIFDGTFQIAFKNTAKDNKPVPFGDLSSGEQILITLINAIYTANQGQGLPKLILLDEIDGPLNPSIIGKFVTYLNDNFAASGVTLILATHSPSTIAFAPENSIYLINTNDSEPIKTTTNKEGVDILSEGFVTLSDALKLEKIPQATVIISEGKNYNYLNRSKTIFASGEEDLTILNINIGGCGQLRTLFDFMRNFNSSKNFIFVFDHDYRMKKDSDGKIEIPRNFDDIRASANANNKVYVFTENIDSDSTKGIENLFNKSATASFQGGFNEKSPNDKNSFEKYILARNINEDFENFKSLFDFITGTETSNL